MICKKMAKVKKQKLFLISNILSPPSSKQNKQTKKNTLICRSIQYPFPQNHNGRNKQAAEFNHS